MRAGAEGIATEPEAVRVAVAVLDALG
jgi:hypothetical protein